MVWISDLFKTGLILKGIGGFYYVKTDKTVYECKSRGIFRDKNMSPYPGDYVNIRITGTKTALIEEILKRKNILYRPKIANLDQIVLVISTCEPKPNFFVIDKMLAICEINNIEPILAITKTDLKSASSILDVYSTVGYKMVTFLNGKCNDKDNIKELINGKTTAFVGNSGVGKSTLLNMLDDSLRLETQSISSKLGRGKHTTRQVELFSFCGGYIADTPGFSAIEVFKQNSVNIMPEDILYCFREFLEYAKECRFTSCMHECEDGCGVLRALQEGKINNSRYQSYTALLKEVKDIKKF